MACLVWESPRGRVVLTLDRAVAVLGSDPVADLCLDDPSVAGRHALIQVENDRVRITDLGTDTQTRINGAALVPDVPSTIEPGDFVMLGKVVVNFLKTPPPPAQPAPAPPARRPAQPKPAKPQPKAKAPPPPAAAPAPARELPWKWIAVGLAFLVVALGGAFVGLHLAGRKEVPAPPETVAGEPPAPDPPPQPEPDPEPKMPSPPDPEPEPKGPERAQAGTAPAAVFVPVDRCPDLLELDATTFAPVRLLDWNAARVEAIGADGRLYAIPRARVTKIEDRADLERRAKAHRVRLDPEDADARLALAQWCALRHVRGEARRLVGEVLALRPGDAAAMALMAALQGG